MDFLFKLLTTAAAVTGAWVAVQGLQAWRAQLIGKAEYELARRLLRGVLEVRDQISSVRGPFMSAGEMEVALKAEGIPPEPNRFDGPHQKKATELAYNRRWAGVTKAMADLRPDLLEAEVLWGDPIKAAHRSLLNCVGTLFSSLSMYLRAQDNPRLQKRLGDKYEEHFEVVYQVSEDPAEDKFAARVADAIREFEIILRPHLSQRRLVKVVSTEGTEDRPA